MLCRIACVGRCSWCALCCTGIAAGRCWWDSAHGMLPHHGQGANTTIEDAITLAELLTQSGRSTGTR
jgi:hypothetical protein